MTRINLLHASLLTDQHLLAEYRELTRIPTNVRKQLLEISEFSLQHKVPPTYRLGTGHVTFFYDKMKYLYDRYTSLHKELKRRNFNLDKELYRKYITLFKDFENTLLWKDYTPTEEALNIIKERLNFKLSIKENWYNYYGVSITDKTSNYPRQLIC